MYTAKICSKNYECVIMQVKKSALIIQSENAPKALAAGLRLGPLWELTALPQTRSWI